MSLDNSPTLDVRAAPKSRRLVGLDAMRAVLLGYGVLVHTANVKLEPIFYFIERSSALFRMSAFFFLSGLLAALTMDRLPPKTWLRSRFAALGIPLVFGLLVLNPLFFLTRSDMPAVSFMAGYATRNRYGWHAHLWFLFSLLAFTVVAFLVRKVLRSRGIAIEHGEPLVPPSPVRSPSLLALLLAFPLLHYAYMIGPYRLVQTVPALQPVEFIIVSTAEYLPFYLAGFLLPYSNGLRSLLSSRLYWLVALLSLPVILMLTQVIDPPRFRGLISTVGKAAFSCAFILVVLPLFLRMRRESRMFTAFSRSAYTLYLVHLLIISICLHAFAWIGWGLYPAAAATVVVAFAAGLAIHFQVVERWPLARLLLNGRYA